ncbi:MAG: glycosyltransferase family 4 protein [Pseudonocardia sp.]|nr:glycosyltransferase family 4 protein [Pseudonocardia sp.]
MTYSAQVPATGGPHWLVVTEEAFVPADSGGRVETANLLAAAAAAGVRLHVIVPGLDANGRELHRRALPGVRLESIPRKEELRSHVGLAPYLFASRPLPQGLPAQLLRDHLADPYDAVVAASFRVAHLGTDLAGRLGVPLVVRPHNVESRYFRQLARSSGALRRWPYLVESWKLRRAEAALHADERVSLFADIAEQDAADRAARTRTPVLHVPPFLTVRPDDGRPDQGRPDGGRPEQGRPGGDATVLFLGSLDNPNNTDAVRWFLDEAWTGVHAAVPGAGFAVVGRRATPELSSALRDRGVRLTVDAPDVHVHLRAAAVFVNPVRAGAGINIKMVEAMAAGLPVVTTTVGARGLHWRPGEHLVVADGAADFTAAVVGLLVDPAERAAIGEAGRRFVRTELDGARHISRMRAALDHPRVPG